MESLRFLELDLNPSVRAVQYVVLASGYR